MTANCQSSPTAVNRGKNKQLAKTPTIIKYHQRITIYLTLVAVEDA